MKSFVYIASFVSLLLYDYTLVMALFVRQNNDMMEIWYTYVMAFVLSFIFLILMWRHLYEIFEKRD